MAPRDDAGPADDEMNQAIQFPGVTNAWTMPIKTPIDMLSTGIKTPVGIKLSGPDLTVLQVLGQEIEAVVRSLPGTLSVYAERVMGGNYLNFFIRRDQIARYGLTVGDVQDVIQSAIGGMTIATTVEGLERYPVNLQYSRELRDSLPAIRDIFVQTPMRQQIPLGQLAELSMVKGPPGIKSEQARPNAWIYVDIQDIDVRTYVQQAQQAVRQGVDIPTGYSIVWSGQYEYMVRAQERMQLIIPGDAPDHLSDHLPEHARGGDHPHRAPGGTTVAGRHLLAPILARLQHERRGVGGGHCSGGAQCRDRCGDVALSGRGVR